MENKSDIPVKTDLKGKVAVVTGGGGVLCSYFSRVLAECGASVAVCDLRFENAEKVAEDINSSGGRAIAVKMNVLDKDSIEEAHKLINEKLGVCDILVNGAGGNNPRGNTDKEQLFPEDLEAEASDLKTFFNLDTDGIRFVFDRNFLGTLMPTQVFAKDLACREGATIINMSSMNSFRPLTKIPAYSGAKAAVSNLTMWLAEHFAPVGIRVNAIAPGFFVTDQNRAMLINEDGSYTPRSKKILANTPMNRFGEVSDLCGSLVFLADSKASGFVNGIVLPVDGGFSAYSGV